MKFVIITTSDISASDELSGGSGIVGAGLMFNCRCVSCLHRLFVFPVSGADVHVPAQHVVRGSAPGEGGHRDVLPGSHPLPLLLLALPHSLLPL